MSKLKFKLLLLTQLPIAWLAGLKLVSYSEQACVISVKLNFLSKNPFKSIFWAVQGMAAELSTGLLCLNIINTTGKKVSMLVVEQQGHFFKKAIGKVEFTCLQGDEIALAIQETIKSGSPKTIQVVSEGKDEKGDTVSRFEFTWSFKEQKRTI